MKKYVKKYVPKNSDQEYTSRGWLEDESEVEVRTVKMVTVRKPQRCALAPLRTSRNHTIQSGNRAWMEKGKINGRWQTNYVCCRCMDIEIREDSL